MMPIAPRAVSASYYHLNLDGIDVGFVQSFEGGDITAEVISEKVSISGINGKHLGALHYEPITLGVRIPTTGPLQSWLQMFMSMHHQRKNGSIIVADVNFKAVKEIEFFNALITEVGFPAADASAKDVAYLTLKIQPEMTRTTKASGEMSSKFDTKQKQALVSNFRLTIDGLDCTRVIKVNAFTVKQPLVSDDIGVTRESVIVPTALEVSNLAVTFSAVSAQSWEEWFDSFVIKGNNGQDQEKSGSLTFLSPTLKEELLTIELSNLGIFSLKSEKAEADQIQRMTAQLYCERMSIKPGK